MSYIEIEGKIKIPVELFQSLKTVPVQVQSSDQSTSQNSAASENKTWVELDGYDREHRWMPLPQTLKWGEVTGEILHTEPTVLLLHNVLTPAECVQLVEHYRHDNRLKRSMVHDNASGQLKFSETRTNSSMWIENSEHALLQKVDDLLSRITTIPADRGELFQIMQYRSGEEFQPHDDFFYNLGENSSFEKAGQRIATAILYLSEAQAGGETWFPKLNIEVQGRVGSVLYFEYTDGNGKCTELCRHAGKPVIRGEKWNLTKWYREKSWK